MKKITLSLLALTVGICANAQDKPYNKWSVDLNAGIAKPVGTLSKGYTAKTFENLHLDGGVRYSINNKIGVKASFGYDKIDNWTNSNLNVQSNFYRTSLEGVVNLGRVLNFENWTNTLGLQFHAGGGYSWLNGDNFSGTDNMGHIMAGLTGQVKLHRRVALNADFTVIQNTQHDRTWDGLNTTDRAVFQGTMFNASMGISIYLGKHGQHADWYSEESQTKKDINSLANRLDQIEAMLVDTDNDGVADYLDLEPNTPAGALVDSRGRNIDKNNNGIADNIEDYFQEKYGNTSEMNADDAAMVKELINKGYVAVNFDFDKVQPTTIEGVNFIVAYMKNNPSASLEVNGYADSTGNKDYNQKLSTRRANAVKDLLVKAGVPAGKVSAKGNGIDGSQAKNIARKVVFKVN
ncbi:OmpA family protein [Myroides fluvii]|uniref:OmpA family protein n=1 Tax=Myroides fluvii TaxID=2572594 RepID=UPI00131C82F7|nr:OmpA family protein [Myroides fluvii]